MGLPLPKAILFPLVAAASLLPAVRSVAAQEYYFQNITPEDGLSQRIVYDIVQDHRGFMWLATRDGLNRYDGHRFKVYRHVRGDSTSLSDSKVTGLLVTSDGTLWIGTMAGGLNEFDPVTETFRSWQHVPGEEGLTANMVRDLEVGPDGDVWILTGDFVVSIFSRETEIINPLQLQDSVGNAAMLERNTFARGPERVYVTCGWGGDSLGSPSWLDRLGTCTPVLPEGTQLLAVSDSLFLVREWPDLLVVNRTTGKVLRRFARSVSGSLSFHGLKTDTEFVVSGGEGLVRLSRKSLRYRSFRKDPSNPDSLRDQRILATYEDRSGNLWIGTHDGVSVMRVRRGPFHAVASDQQGLSGVPVNTFLEQVDGSLWVGTEEGLFRKDRTGFKGFLQSELPIIHSYNNNNRIWSLAESGNGQIWVGTGRGGLHQFLPDRERFTYQREFWIAAGSRVPDQTAVPSILRASNGFTWFASQYHVTAYDRTNGFLALQVDERKQSSHNYINILHEDDHDRIWAGNDEGLHQLDTGTGELLAYPDPAGHLKMVWAITESPKTPGVLWAGTVGTGLVSVDTVRGHVTPYGSAEGLPSDIVYGVLPDDRGDLWFSTPVGLGRFDPATGATTHFTEGDGLHDNEFDLMAYHRGPSGTMYFGGPHGFTYFHPDSVRVDTSTVPIVLSGFRVLDEPRPGLLDSGDTVVLDRRDNSFTVEFGALDFERPESYRYAYRLEGFDREWREIAGLAPEASYTRVPPGDYTFEVRTTWAGGQLDSVGARLMVSITPALWQRAWFRVLVGIGLLASLLASVAAYQRRLQERERREAAEALGVSRLLRLHERRERARLARELHDGPIQALYSVNHDIEDAASLEDLKPAHERIVRLADELRSVCDRLRPPLVETLGLRAALESRISAFARAQEGLSVDVDLAEGCDSLPDAVADVVFTVVSESLANVARHARASTVSVTLMCDGAVARVVVEDDGVGFALPASVMDLAIEQHFGLAGLKERCEEVGGLLSVDSASGEGVRLKAELPIEPSR